jgi:hypothetical protein
VFVKPYSCRLVFYRQQLLHRQAHQNHTSRAQSSEVRLQLFFYSCCSFANGLVICLACAAARSLHDSFEQETNFGSMAYVGAVTLTTKSDDQRSSLEMPWVFGEFKIPLSDLSFLILWGTSCLDAPVPPPLSVPGSFGG